MTLSNTGPYIGTTADSCSGKVSREHTSGEPYWGGGRRTTSRHFHCQFTLTLCLLNEQNWPQFAPHWSSLIAQQADHMHRLTRCSPELSGACQLITDMSAIVLMFTSCWQVIPIIFSFYEAGTSFPLAGNKSIVRTSSSPGLHNSSEKANNSLAANAWTKADLKLFYKLLYWHQRKLDLKCNSTFLEPWVMSFKAFNFINGFNDPSYCNFPPTEAQVLPPVLNMEICFGWPEDTLELWRKLGSGMF